ncbi:Cyclic di-GMP phosphodiesterase response regulator RpfG [Rubripirellula lacrimiformis]|uniref:Cyclic di-GMP phosphodiesterase response regulator RpfG n=1 Tax=Rubripirellula lacrimiformis TaxID=1930273 RepID=A0A517N586_9BACT|nr:HD domain-containing phosphohydrolase [Rubripirellula lacrimiformis]QDT02293.1 Cyclic di-GMP phosphodiesterase response regulator RpfG [Rubripirellula lacrimiformis]
MSGVDFIPISVSTLLPREVVGLDLYQREASSESFKLYRAADYPLTMDDLGRLRGRGVSRLYISKASQSVYQSYLRRVATSSKNDAVPLTARVGALNEVVRDVLQTAFQREDVDKTVHAAEKLGSLATEIISQDEFTASDLFDVLHHDYATFTHSANVAFYSGLLASELGYSETDVGLITTGGLLHDLGKLDIGEEILCKPGKLEDHEFRIIRQHPGLGFKKLAHREDLNTGQLMMAYQHHERLDGRGYPVGCVEADIHPWAKLCSVVDVFEALTSQRPYRSPMPRRKALELLDRDCGKAFDPEVLACWKSIIHRDLAN